MTDIKLCKDCKHNYSDEVCDSAIYKDPYDGVVTHYFHVGIGYPCRATRQNVLMCGPDAKYFEPKEG